MNPPYSGTCIILYEHQDGINVRVYHYADVLPGQPIPKGILNLETQLFKSLATADSTPPGLDAFVHRNASTRTALKTAFGNFLDNAFPDTPA